MNAAAIALFALLPLQQDPQDPQLLPDAPPGWRFERIDFPLSFAPDIELRGFEELRFGPGMFDPEADSYFSYAIAIRAEGDQPIDEEWLGVFLASYYRGLSRAVAADKDFALDLDQIRAEVVLGGPGFVARVFAFDAFTSGEPLTLDLELSVVRGDESTELLGLASPKGKDEPVWAELRGLRESWRAAREPEIFLNHLYFVADTETYAAIAANDFLRGAFAVTEERSTVRADRSYTGLYFYGESTYFEFLQPDSASGFDPGESGVAFGVEREGGTDWMAEALDGRGVRSFIGPITRGLAGEQLPWFRMLGVERPTAAARLQLFSLEYDPAFLERWNGDLPPVEGGIARAAVLERYAARLGVHERRRALLFEDVTEVHLALGEKERARLLETAGALGYRIAEEEGVWTCAGPGYHMVVRASEGPGGVTGFVATLRRGIREYRLQLGRMSVVVEGRRASFSME